MAIEVLIIDDSAFMRKVLTDIIVDMKDVEVVGIGRNGLDGLNVIKELKPDIITLDVEMPGMNGIETLKIIKKRYDIPVIMLSSKSDADTTMEALEIGAEDFLEKPEKIKASMPGFALEFEEKIKSVIKYKDVVQEDFSMEAGLPKDIEAVCIAASAGGPKALLYLVKNIPKDIRVPIFIVQHMPAGFTKSFAERLSRESNIQVLEAKDGMRIRPGKAYLAPGDYHMFINKDRIKLDNGKVKLHGVRPAADYMFESATKIYKDKILGIILTGMGRDGAIGMKAVKDIGGYNIAQDEESCVVYGMPGHAVDMGVIQKILSLEEISKNLNEIVRMR